MLVGLGVRVGDINHSNSTDACSLANKRPKSGVWLDFNEVFETVDYKLFDLLQFESSVSQNCLLVLVLVLAIFLGIINHVGRTLAKLQRFSLGLHSILVVLFIIGITNLMLLVRSCVACLLGLIFLLK